MYPLVAPGPHTPSPATQQKSNWLLTFVYQSWGRLCPCGIMCPFPYQSVYQAYNEPWMAQSGSYDHLMAKECQAVWLTALSRLSGVGKEFPKEKWCATTKCAGQEKKKKKASKSTPLCFVFHIWIKIYSSFYIKSPSQNWTIHTLQSLSKCWMSGVEK